jgi:hypothetical protein
MAVGAFDPFIPIPLLPEDFRLQHADECAFPLTIGCLVLLAGL